MAKDKGKGKPGKGDADAADDKNPDAAGEGEDGAVAKKKPPLMMLIIAGVGALVVIGGGITGFLLLAPHGPPDAHARKPPPKHKPEKPEGGKPDPNAPVIADGPDGVVFYTPPDIVVNMQTADNKPTFLKLKLTFELPDHDTADELEPEMPRLQDMFQTFLRELRPEDLSGSQGTYQLRLELQRRINLIIAPSKVNAVLIEEMLIN